MDQGERVTSGMRQAEILKITREHGKVHVEDLSRHFDVTVHTIRRDLAELARAGHVQRVHGGAIIANELTNLDYVKRQQQNAEGKKQIAKACAAAIPNNAAVFINIGTTTEAVARELMDHKGLMVVTNSLNTANILAGNPDIDIIVAGGSLRRADGGLLGNLTKQVVDFFKFDYAVISCAGIDSDGELLDFDLQEVTATQAIIARSRSTYVVADHSKIRRTAPGRIGSVKDIDVLFTDAEIPETIRQAWPKADYTVEVAGPAA